MKRCSINRKLISWLALDALEARQARDLRAHLESCEGCRRYFEEISKVAETLTATELRPDVQASAFFHRRVMAKLRQEESASARGKLVASLRGTMLNWRVALPVVVATAALLAALSRYERRLDASSRKESRVPPASAVDLKRDLPPTIANYQMIANQSLEKLDELLNRQANRKLSPTRIYTASNALD